MIAAVFDFDENDDARLRQITVEVHRDHRIVRTDAQCVTDLLWLECAGKRIGVERWRVERFPDVDFSLTRCMVNATGIPPRWILAEGDEA